VLVNGKLFLGREVGKFQRKGSTLLLEGRNQKHFLLLLKETTISSGTKRLRPGAKERASFKEAGRHQEEQNSNDGGI